MRRASSRAGSGMQASPHCTPRTKLQQGAHSYMQSSNTYLCICPKNSVSFDCSLSVLSCCCRSPCADAEDSDMQDTASSGGSMRSNGSSQRQRLALAAPACTTAQPACARGCAGHAAGEEDSISSEQRPLGAGKAGQITGNYPCAGVDVSSLYCWEVLQNVLDDI